MCHSYREHTNRVGSTGLDDLCVRFIINLPREELESVERICFQVEEAQWFYEDFIRPLDPALPSLSLKAFALRIFQHCPLMSQWSHYHHITAFSEFLAYKTRVPVRGAILLSQDMEEVVLVKGWKKGANWSFPRGKINKDEKDLDCAIREVYEETGFDIRAAGLVKDENGVKSIEVTMREQHMKLYVFRGVPRNVRFEPRTRKEISRIEWYKLSELPTLMKKSKQYDQGFAVANANKFYMVAPFMNPLKKWIAQQRKIDARAQVDSKQFLQTEGETSMDEANYAVNCGHTPGQVPTEMALPSQSSSEDVSSHLKRLLNIDGAAARKQFTQLEPTSVSNVSKSNALLALLQGGSHKVPAQAQNPAMPLSLPSAIPEPQHSYPPSNLFPGFSQQSQSTGQASRISQDGFPGRSQPTPAPPLQHAFMHHVPTPTSLPSLSQGSNSRPLGRDFPPLSLPNYQQVVPYFPSQQLSAQSYQDRQSGSQPYEFPLSRKQVPAPYQQTGDPQFSQQAQYPQTQGATVPAASQLPPPKLSSHSLALLNVFKGGAIKTEKTPNPPAVPDPEDTTQSRKPSQHQDYLLSLLKGSPSISTREPVELAARPVSPAAKQILRRPRNDSNSSRQRAVNAGNLPTHERRKSATVSGPLSDFENVAKPSAKKAANGTKRQSNKSQQSANIPSPVTILSRPTRGAGRESPNPVAQRSRTPQHSRKSDAPVPLKPFQPQILRRGEKPESEIPHQIRTVSLPEDQTGETVYAFQKNQSQIDPELQPSQSASQKDLLLSLFGKAPASSNGLPPKQLVSRPSTAGTPEAPRRTTPQSPLNLLSNNKTLSSSGTSSDGGAQSSTTNEVESPVNKAFLLGFLEGVAKGKK